MQAFILGLVWHLMCPTESLTVKSDCIGEAESFGLTKL